MTPGTEREHINNQKRIIRELKRIAEALEKIANNTNRSYYCADNDTYKGGDDDD